MANTDIYIGGEPPKKKKVGRLRKGQTVKADRAKMKSLGKEEPTKEARMLKRA